MQLNPRAQNRQERAFGLALVLGAAALALLGIAGSQDASPDELERIEQSRLADRQRAIELVHRSSPRAAVLRSDAEILSETSGRPVLVADAD